MKKQVVADGNSRNRVKMYKHPKCILFGTCSLPAVINAGVPLFAAMGSTRMMCADMTIEDAMLPALGSVVDFKLDGNTLLLLNADGQTVMTLVKR